MDLSDLHSRDFEMFCVQFFFLKPHKVKFKTVTEHSLEADD